MCVCERKSEREKEGVRDRERGVRGGQGRGGEEGGGRSRSCEREHVCVCV